MMKKLWSVLSLLLLMTAQATAGNIALVMDDIGYDEEDGDIFRFPKAVNVSIIPDAPLADVRHAQAKAQGRDILIHLPMEAISYQKLEPHHIRAGMSEKEVNNVMDFARKTLPAAIGLNNHMGSKATADRATMTHLMKALKKHQLHFLDSRTTHKTVAADVAKQVGLSVQSRHIFLDNTPEEVSRQWAKAIQFARKHGTAVIIAHPRPHTLAVLKRELTRLPKDIHLVPMHQLWQGENQVKSLPFNTLFYGKSFRPIF